MKSLTIWLLGFTLTLHGLSSVGQIENKTWQGERELFTTLKNVRLLADTSFFPVRKNSSFKLNSPLKVQMVLKADKPWESSCVGFSTIAKEDGTYRMYYQSFVGMDRYFCLATSKDGIKWEKPNLGIVEFKGSKNNNIISKDSYETGGVFKREINGKAQYVWLGMKKDYKYYYYTSPDGLHFSTDNVLVMSYISDTQNQLFFDINKNKMVGYFRSWVYDSTQKQYYRTVSYSPITSNTKIHPESKRFVEHDKRTFRWGKQFFPAIDKEMKRSMILDYKKPENKDKDIYTHQVFPYGKYYLAFPSIFSHFKTDQNDGVNEVSMYFSLNGEDWKEIGKYIGSEYLPGFKQYFMQFGHAMKGDTILNYFFAEKNSHNVVRTNSSIYVAPQVKNRYISLHGGDKIASVTSVKQAGNYKSTSINFQTRKNGYIIIELLNSKGKVINQTQKLSGDFVDLKIPWKSGLTKNGHQIRIIFTNSDLFALTF